MKFASIPIYSMMIGKDFITVVLDRGDGRGGDTKVIKGDDFKKVMGQIKDPIEKAFKGLS